MTRKTLGYTQLEWVCPNCDTRNPGPQKVCSSCGMPQPEDVEFRQPAQEKLITGQAQIDQAKSGPDIHCYYCGSRNPAGAKTCSQCGAPLSEGKARKHGQVLGAHRGKPAAKVTCPACGAPNQPDAPRCAQCGASLVQPEPARPKTAAKPKPGRGMRFGIVGGIILVALIGACVAFFVLLTRTEDTTGRVKNVSWTRQISIEALVPVTREDWRDNIPPGAVISACTEKVHHTEQRPTGQQREICGTPYTVDTGSGFGEVVQDCTTEDIMESVEVYAESCRYTVEVWQKVDEATLTGNDYNPRWPSPLLKPGQREAERQENYTITFTTQAGTYTYSTHNQNLFNQAQIGTEWILKVNTFNTVTAIEPVE